ncbi:hypothetical protein [Sphaerisporangium sp. NPDC051011]|uniref:hypothetical protein n=1 Tax=Sphaerisporangium sp. NPDC051011 TaxID=3155792 RepID=UPI0033E94360
MIGRLTTDALGPTYLEVEGHYSVNAEGRVTAARFNEANAQRIVDMANHEAAQSCFWHQGMRFTPDGAAVESYEGGAVTESYERDEDGMYPIGDTWGWEVAGESEADRCR